MRKLDKKKIYISEWGAVPVNCKDSKGHVDSDNARIVVDVSKPKWSYVATTDFLDKSDVFVHLRKPNEPHKELPRFKDVFRVKRL
jgi:hypothetical protein